MLDISWCFLLGAQNNKGLSHFGQLFDNFSDFHFSSDSVQLWQEEFEWDVEKKEQENVLLKRTTKTGETNK